MSLKEYNLRSKKRKSSEEEEHVIRIPTSVTYINTHLDKIAAILLKNNSFKVYCVLT
jgi:hypothetical protein